MRRFTALILFIAVVGGIAAPTYVSAATQPGIVALGDSVAAGAGLEPASGAQNQSCGRSKQAYAYKVAQTLGESLVFLPCTGAKVDEGIYGTQELDDGSRIAPQLDKAFTYGSPKQVLVTIGANDMRWYKLMQQCYVYTCGTKLDSARTVAYRADLRYELSRMIYTIRSRTNGTSKIYLSGYYLPFDNASCIISDKRTGSISDAERQWVALQTTKLNDAIESVASAFRDVAFVPVSFAGHEACTSDPWVQGIDGSMPLHPTVRGQKEIGNSFVRVIRSQP